MAAQQPSIVPVWREAPMPLALTNWIVSGIVKPSGSSIMVSGHRSIDTPQRADKRDENHARLATAVLG
jgi:hypothetical protein